MRWVLLLSLICAVFSGVAQAQQQDSGETVNCIIYRSKKDKIPVYAEATTTSKVIYRIQLGEKVCHIGERADFAIVDWRHHEKLNNRESSALENKDRPELVYVSKFDLWPPRDAQTEGPPQGVFGRIKQYFDFMRFGGVPDSAYGSYGTQEPECKAGKICAELEKEK